MLRELSEEEAQLYKLAEWSKEADGEHVEKTIADLERQEKVPKSLFVEEAFYYALSEMYYRLYELEKTKR